MMDRIVSDIKLLDTAPARIVLEAMVTEIDQSKENKFNFSWNWRYFGLSTDGTTSNTISYAKAIAQPTWPRSWPPSTTGWRS